MRLANGLPGGARSQPDYFHRSRPAELEVRTTKAAADPTRSPPRRIPHTSPPIKSVQSTITDLHSTERVRRAPRWNTPTASNKAVHDQWECFPSPLPDVAIPGKRIRNRPGTGQVVATKRNFLKGLLPLHKCQVKRTRHGIRDFSTESHTLQRWAGPLPLAERTPFTTAMRKAGRSHECLAVPFGGYFVPGAKCIQ